MKVWNQYLVDSRFYTRPSLMKMHLSLVLYSGIIVDHLAAENQVPKFALNWHGRVRNGNYKGRYWPSSRLRLYGPRRSRGP